MAFTVGTGSTAGAGVAFAPSGAMNIQSTAVGNVGAGPDVLHTFSLPANSLVVTNRGIRWEGTGSFANNANAKTLDVEFGAQIFTLAAPAGLLGVAVQWKGEAKIIRTGASAQRYAVAVRFSVPATGAVLEFAAQGTLTQTETAAIVIRAVAAVSTSNNDIVQNTSVVSYF